MLVELVLVSLLAATPTPEPVFGTNTGSGDSPPPAVLAGGRSVTTRNATGGIQRLTIIPSTSMFAQYKGGASAPCSFTATRDDFLLSNGDVVPKGTRVTSNYLFVEGLAVALDVAPAVLPDDIVNATNRGPLEDALRTFTVFCDRAFYAINQVGIIEVPLLDPLLDPHRDLANLRNTLQLDQSTVFTNPIVGTYGGLVTRYPTWLAIEPESWHTQPSPTRMYRGATLMLIAVPRDLTFTVAFTPNPDKPSRPFRGIVGCVPGIAAAAGDGALPAFPTLPDQTEPGVNGNCSWTPPGPGTVTITAHTTFSITFWADGYTEADDDYVRDSEPATYTTGELIAVNTKP
jgi:hypothetical protein